MKPLILALAMAASLSAAAIPLFNTGTDALNNPLGPANSTSKPNLLETHFSLISGPANAFLTRWQAPYYSETGLDARWISPAVSQPGAAPTFQTAAASYVLEQSFNMALFNISTASLSGFIAADNCAVISLNTTVLASTGGSCPGSGSSLNFTTLTPFSATSSAFIAGINVLRINYSNATSGPAALLVTGLQGTADQVPEPATYALIGASLIAIQLKRRLS